MAHLDIKLDNLLLSKDYKLKITDFGCSSELNNTDIKNEGTEDYRAPEIIRGNCREKGPADIFSMGIILFLLKYHVFPFSEKGLD